MAEVSNDLIYEVPKQLQDRLTNIDAKMTDLKGEMQALRGHMISLQTDVHNIYAVLSRHDAQLERIEKRLGLAEPAL